MIRPSPSRKAISLSIPDIPAPTLARPIDGARERARALLDIAGLSDRVDHLPSELSTGERRRTALARALLPTPRLLLADEPTGDLDERKAALVMEQIHACANRGGAVLMVTYAAGAIMGVRKRLEPSRAPSG